MKSLFLELWAVASLQICPELSGGRKGGGEESLFVQEERNCQRDCTDKCEFRVVLHIICRSRTKLPLVNNWKDGLWGKLCLTTEGQCDE